MARSTPLSVAVAPRFLRARRRICPPPLGRNDKGWVRRGQRSVASCSANGRCGTPLIGSRTTAFRCTILREQAAHFLHSEPLPFTSPASTYIPPRFPCRRGGAFLCRAKRQNTAGARNRAPAEGFNLYWVLSNGLCTRHFCRTNQPYRGNASKV